MKNKIVFRLTKFTGFLFLAAVFFSCASTPAANNQPVKENNQPATPAPPLWVTDQERAYPDREWLCVVEAEQDVKLAQNAAVIRLSQVFRVDLLSISDANRYKYARYVLNYSLKNKAGVELFSSSDNGREGHTSDSEARQRAIRAAEQFITTDGFAKNFDAFFASLL